MIFDPNYKEVDIKGYEGLYKISNKGDVTEELEDKAYKEMRHN